MVPDKPSLMDYTVKNLQAFIFECGRTQGILQSDKEDTRNALPKTTAAKIGSMTVRHAPSYSSNSQGSVERLHRTKHCLLPWIVRHAAWTVNRYVVHSDGYTSFERRWGRNYGRAHYFIFHHNTRNFQKQTYGCRNASGSEKFPKPEKTTSQRKQAYKKYEQHGDYNQTSTTISYC